MPAPDIALIGAGRMGLALAEGWLSQKDKPRLALIDPKPSEHAQSLARKRTVSLNAEPEPAAVAIIAVKPQVFRGAAENMRPWIGPETLVISIMAGTRVKTLRDELGTQNVIRAMPNTPGAIGRGVSVISVPAGVSDAHAARARDLLAPLGRVEGPVPEDKLSAVTALSGSGPAYLFLLVEAMAGAGEAEGLAPDLAETLARETVAGAAQLMMETGDDAVSLRKAVTSPGGTTAAALDLLMEDNGIPSLIRQAMRAAAIRERSLASE